MKIVDILNRAIGKVSGRFNESKNPSPSTTGNSSEPKFTKVDDLLAFRTIITMLSALGSHNTRLHGELSIDNTTTTTDERVLLRLLDALSAVLVRRYEITAVVAHPYGGNDVQVFVSVVHSNRTKSLLQPSQAGNRCLRNHTVAINPRHTPVNSVVDSLMNSTSLPRLTADYGIIPQDLVDAANKSEANRDKAINSPVLEVFLKNHW
jgi:hypothetical protein